MLLSGDSKGGLVDSDEGVRPSADIEKDTSRESTACTDPAHDDGDTVAIDELLSEVESCKDRGNVEFHKGRVLARHTAGKNLLRDACIAYAEGLHTLGKADARLSAEHLRHQQHQQQHERNGDPDEKQEDRHHYHHHHNQQLPVTNSCTDDDDDDDERKPAGATSTYSTATSPPASQGWAEGQDASSGDHTSSRISALAHLAALSKRADAVRPFLYLNLAACNLLLQEWTPAIACCTHVLDECCGDILLTSEEGSHGEVAQSSCVSNESAAATLAAAESMEAQSVGKQRQEHEHQQDALELKDQSYSKSESSSDTGRGGGCGGRRSCHAQEGAVEAAPRRCSEDERRQAEKSRLREIAAKSLYRRAAAQAGSENLSAALGDLQQALRLKPRDAAISRELKKVEKRVTEEKAKESLRRETEEGKRRLQRQRQQLRQGKPCSAERDGDASIATVIGENITARQQAPAAPTADHAVTSGGEEGSKPLLGRGTPHDVSDTNVGARRSQARGEDRESSKSPVDQRHVPRRSNEDEDDEEEKAQGLEEGLQEVSEDRESEDAFPTWNGGECRGGLYAWNQSVREVQVCVKVPDWARASDLRVEIRRSQVSVGLAVRREDVEDIDVVLAGSLTRPVQVDECLWTMERAGRVLLHLQKELPSEGEPGYEWWSSVLEGDLEVDVTTCDAGSDASQYPEHARRRGAKALWEYQNKRPEEKLEEERMRDARWQMEKEVEERQRDLEKAMKDPRKAELYRQLRETMPDTTISIK